MINAKELRVGNLLRVSIYASTEDAKESLGDDYSLDKEWQIDKVIGICHPNEDFMYWSSLGEEEQIQRIEGIPIAEDFLVHAGFVKEFSDVDYYYSLELNDDKYCDLCLLSYSIKEEMEVGLFPYDNYFKCRYVHEVQNLYYSITGKELKIDE